MTNYTSKERTAQSWKIRERTAWKIMLDTAINLLKSRKIEFISQFRRPQIEI